MNFIKSATEAFRTLSTVPNSSQYAMRARAVLDALWNSAGAEQQKAALDIANVLAEQDLISQTKALFVIQVSESAGNCLKISELDRFFQQKNDQRDLKSTLGVSIAKFVELHCSDRLKLCEVLVTREEPLAVTDVANREVVNIIRKLVKDIEDDPKVTTPPSPGHVKHVFMKTYGKSFKDQYGMSIRTFIKQSYPHLHITHCIALRSKPSRMITKKQEREQSMMNYAIKPQQTKSDQFSWHTVSSGSKRSKFGFQNLQQAPPEMPPMDLDTIETYKSRLLTLFPQIRYFKASEGFQKFKQKAGQSFFDYTGLSQYKFIEHFCVDVLIRARSYIYIANSNAIKNFSVVPKNKLDMAKKKLYSIITSEILVLGENDQVPCAVLDAAFRRTHGGDYFATRDTNVKQFILTHCDDVFTVSEGEMVSINITERSSDDSIVPAMSTGKGSLPQPTAAAEKPQKIPPLFFHTVEKASSLFSPPMSPPSPIIQKRSSDITHYHVIVEDEEEKKRAFTRLVRTWDIQQSIVFCNSQMSSMNLAYSLSFDDKSVAIVTDKMLSDELQSKVTQFLLGRYKFLIATAPVAMQLDIPEVEYVINYDMCHAFGNYVHRTAKGTGHRTINLVRREESYSIREIERMCNISIPLLPESCLIATKSE